VGKDILVVVNRKCYLSFTFFRHDLNECPGSYGNSHKEICKCTRRLGGTIMWRFVSQILFLSEEGEKFIHISLCVLSTKIGQKK
jgi:hypothetical protein